jgi:hypothetical protein
MKYYTPTFILVAAALTASSCDKKQTASQQLDAVQDKSAEVAAGIDDYAYSQKEAFIAAQRTQLAALNRDLDELAAKVEKSSEAVRADAQPRIKTLRDQTARLNKHLDDAADATESGWDQLKADIKQTQAASKEEFNKARLWLSEKIAP